jgi:hypothetical protein
MPSLRNIQAEAISIAMPPIAWKIVTRYWNVPLGCRHMTNGSKIVTDALGDYTIGAPDPEVTGMLHCVVLRRLLFLTPYISSPSGLLRRVILEA